MTYNIPIFGNVIGEHEAVKAGSAVSLTELAQQYDIGMYEIARANPHLNRKRLEHNTNVIIPAQLTLPCEPKGSHGCISLYNPDIKELFYMIPIGTVVRVVYEPHDHE